MEIINSGMQMKFMIEGDQLPDIFSSVGEEISIFHKGWKFLGNLLRVSSKIRKDENKDPYTWKELTILIDQISLADDHYAFPNKKEFFVDNFDIVV